MNIKINNLHVLVNKKNVLRGINYSIEKPGVYVIMGPNGSGKSSLALTLMGHPAYEITQGDIVFGIKKVNALSVDARARNGLFLALQNPYEIDGVTYRDFLWQAYRSLYDGTKKQITIKEFYKKLSAKCALLDIPENFLDRYVNVGFSGGEKKKGEILQLAVLEPKIAILDEIDSGLDVDAIKKVCSVIRILKEKNNMTFILITHQQKFLECMPSSPDRVDIMSKGKIIKSGDSILISKVLEKGFY
jgi:Fe-S cluster assembly ATP-binding protein